MKIIYNLIKKEKIMEDCDEFCNFQEDYELHQLCSKLQLVLVEAYYKSFATDLFHYYGKRTFFCSPLLPLPLQHLYLLVAVEVFHFLQSAHVILLVAEVAAEVVLFVPATSGSVP